MSLARLRAQAAFEARLLLRNGENLLATMIIPVGLLVFFSLVRVLPSGGQAPAAFLAPGVLALSVVAAGVVSLGISTGFERSYLVLKRLGATPLRRAELVAAKVLAVLGVQALQAVAITAAGLLLGWRPDVGPASLALAVTAWLLGTAACCGLGLALAGRLPALATLAITNGLFIVLLLCSGIIFPLDVLPAPLRVGAQLLPAAPLAELLRAALGPEPLAAGAVLMPLAVLTTWAVAAPWVAARVFHWE